MPISTPQELLNLGVKAHQSGDLHKAEKIYKKVIEKNPEHPDANHNLGVLLVNVGQFKEALPYFKLALTYNERSVQFFISYITTLLKLDLFDEALYFITLAKERGLNAEALDKLEVNINLRKSNLGSPSDDELNAILELYRSRQFNELELKTLRLLKSYPTQPKLYNILGVSYIRQEKFDQSLEVLQKASQLEPENAELYNNIGIALNAKGRPEEALSSYTRALQQDPNYADAYNNLGNSLLSLGRLMEAVRAYDQAIAKAPKFVKAIRNKGRALSALGKLQPAIEAFSLATKLKPDYADAFNDKGIALASSGKIDEAISCYKEVLKNDDSYFHAHNNLGVAYTKLRNFDAAKHHLQCAIEIYPNFAEAHSNLGNVLTEQNKYYEAKMSCNTALDINPGHAPTYNNLGIALTGLGDLDEARNAYSHALQIDPTIDGCFENFFSLNIQLPFDEKFCDITENWLRNNIHEKSFNPRREILCSIKFFLQGNFAKTHHHLNNFNSIEHNTLKLLTPSDRQFCIAYAGFIGALLQENFGLVLVHHGEEHAKALYHLGESHCLSYAHNNLMIQKSKYTIFPNITFGAKAYHFAKKDNNKFKVITLAKLNALPEQAKIFLSFGEIDCQPDEGIIKAEEKLNAPLEEIVEKTVYDYVEWFAEVNSTKSFDLHFINIPAPVFSDYYSHELNKKRAHVVYLFNSALEKFTSIRGLKLLDVYSLTENNGFSNRRFHIDTRHLGAKILPKIEEQLRQFIA